MASYILSFGVKADGAVAFPSHSKHDAAAARWDLRQQQQPGELPVFCLQLLQGLRVLRERAVVASFVRRPCGHCRRILGP